MHNFLWVWRETVDLFGAVTDWCQLFDVNHGDLWVLLTEWQGVRYTQMHVNCCRKLKLSVRCLSFWLTAIACHLYFWVMNNKVHMPSIQHFGNSGLDSRCSGSGTRTTGTCCNLWLGCLLANWSLYVPSLPSRRLGTCQFMQKICLFYDIVKYSFLLGKSTDNQPMDLRMIPQSKGKAVLYETKR